jgi:hypothetical protein|tara:strand:- start:233 stop:409 length:177 start_codon:yes stop_codon:yes gene_type:complete
MLNNTLEEELRVLLCEQKKEIAILKQNIQQLQSMVAEESEQKYRAYIKYADLQREFDI